MRPESFRRDMVQGSVVNRASLLRTVVSGAHDPIDVTRSVPRRCSGRTGPIVFPLASRLSSSARAEPLSRGFVRRFTGTIRLSTPQIVHLRIAASAFPERPTRDHGGRSEISRFSRMEVPRMPWFFDRAGSAAACIARLQYCLPLQSTCQHPGLVFSRLFSPLPVLSTANASAAPLRVQTHGLGSPWFAIPSVQGFHLLLHTGLSRRSEVTRQ